MTFGVPLSMRRMSGCSGVRVGHREQVGRAAPAGHRLGHVGQVPRRDVQERRRTGTGVEVLVRAADREVDLVGVEDDRQHAG